MESIQEGYPAACVSGLISGRGQLCNVGGLMFGEIKGFMHERSAHSNPIIHVCARTHCLSAILTLSDMAVENYLIDFTHNVECDPSISGQGAPSLSESNLPHHKARASVAYSL
jgi:hypothetical protein